MTYTTRRKGIKKLSFEERELIEQKLGQEISFAKIAKQMGRSKSCISAEIRRGGGFREYTAARAQKKTERRPYSEGSRPYGNKFTEEEVAIIRDHLAKDWSTNRIRELIGCSHLKLRIWLARQQGRSEQLELPIEKKLSKGTDDLEQRIAALEQQIDIILDIIKEKK